MTQNNHLCFFQESGPQNMGKSYQSSEQVIDYLQHHIYVMTL
jgi:hypothetical protein